MRGGDGVNLSTKQKALLALRVIEPASIKDVSCTSGIEHRRLAKLLNAYQHTRIVISYYAHPCLSELYPPEQWDHLNAAINKNLHVQNKRGAKPGKAPEVLIVNKKGI